MKRWWVYIVMYLIVGVLGLSPFEATDVATLSPVEVIWLEQQGNLVRIETDGKDIGIGKSVLEALENMKRTAPGTVFLDTADYLIVRKGNEKLISQMKSALRPSCSVCIAQEKPDLLNAAKFLSIHEPSIKLKDIRMEEYPMPQLDQTEGRLELIE